MPFSANGRKLLIAAAMIACLGMQCPDSGTDNDNQNQNTNDNVSTNENQNTNDNMPDDEISQPGPDGVELEALESASSVKPFIAYDGEVPSHVEIRVPAVDFDPTNPVGAALDYLETYRHFYRIEEPAAELFPGRVHHDDTGDHVFFQQQINGIVVHGAELAVHMNGGMVVGSNGHYLVDLRDPGAPAISARKAIDIAAADAGGSGEDLKSAVREVIFNGKLIGHPDQQTRLAWQLLMGSACAEGGKCGTWQYFIDAMTGEIIFVENKAQSCDKDFDINNANNTTSNNCWDLPWETADDEMYDEDGRWCGVFDGCATTTPDGFNAFNNAHRVYDYYAGTFGRCGWDGDDAQLEVMVHVAFNPANALYSPSCDYLAFSNGYPVLDVFAHEFTHAVTRWTSGLGSSFQPGALNEHYSDVMGSMLDGNWQMGEGIPGGAIRDMSNPSARSFGDPDHMQAASSPGNVGFKNLPSTNDNGGVHTNAGIPNKAAFLMTDGGTQAGITVNGIGRDKVMRLFYYTLTGRLTGGSQFIDARNATVSLAREWALNGNVNGFTLRDVCSVINAYAAVGLGAQDLDCDGYDDVDDTDDDGDFVPDSRDNCPRVKNPLQEDNDHDGIGDACDSDDDNDGIPDNVDGCPFAFNPDQADMDGDGVMDACDNCPNSFIPVPGRSGILSPFADPDQTDTDGDGHGNICDDDDDGDGVPDADDNCPVTYNPTQTDLNGDGIGLVCDQAELSALDRNNELPPTQLPVDPGECISCGDYFMPDIRTHIEVVMRQNIGVRIVDEAGNVAAKYKGFTKGDVTGNWTFDFNPKASAFYRFPERATNSRFVSMLRADQSGRRVLNSTRYFLEVLPQANSSQDLAPVSLHVETGSPAQ